MSQLGLGLGLTRGGGVPFNPLSLNPYLLFDTRSSMIGTFENPTLDLDPSKPDTLNVITATRAGTATYTDADGVIQTASPDTVRVDYTQGEELTPTKFQRVENTDFSNWSHARTSDTANAAISPDGQNNATYLEQNTGETNAGSIYRSDSSFTGVFTLSVYAKKKEKDFVVLYDSNTGRTYFNLDTGTVGTVHGGNTAKIEDAGDGWFRCSVTFTASSGTVKAFYVGDTDNSTVVTDSGGIYIYGPQLEEGTTASSFVANTTGSPKFITGATYGPRVPMILVEPSATNLFRNSQDLTASPNNVANGTITQESETFKGQPVFRFTDDTSSGEHRLSIPAGSVTASRVIVHFFVKPDTCTKFCITYPTAGDAAAAWNLQSGSALGSTVGSAVAQTIEDAGDGWFKVSMTYDRPTATTTGHNIQTLQDSATSAANRNYQGDGTLSFLMTMPQLEYGEVQTSFIPTSGSTVQRAADDLVISGSDFTDFYNGSEGTIYAEFVPKRNDDYRHVYEFSNGTTAQRINLHLQSAEAIFYSQSSGSLYVNSTNSVAGATIDVLHRSAFSYKTNDAPASFDGGSEIPDTEYSVPSGINRVYLGDYTPRDGNYILNGHIKRLIYWPLHSDSL
jgi:hypothetical protein